MNSNSTEYKNLHRQMRREIFKPKFCQECQAVAPLDLANKSNRYLKLLDDWEWLCRKCHMKKDGRLEILLVSYNQPRKTCKHGHKLDGDNVIVRKEKHYLTGKVKHKRSCRTCERIKSRQRYWDNIEKSRKYKREYARKLKRKEKI